MGSDPTRGRQCGHPPPHIYGGRRFDARCQACRRWRQQPASFPPLDGTSPWRYSGQPPGLEFPGGRIESWGLVTGGYGDTVHRNLPPVGHFVSIFSTRRPCCTGVIGLFVAVFPRTPTFALVSARGTAAAHARLGAPERLMCVCSLQCFCSACGSTSFGGSASLTH